MAKTPLVPWQLPDEVAPTVERIEVAGCAIEIPVYGSVTVDEARYLEWHNEHYGGLGSAALMPTASAVYHLLLLRFGVAAWSGTELAAIAGELPTFEQTMTYGNPARLMSSELIAQVYAFFIDEFMANLGKPRTALAATRTEQAPPESETTGATSTGDSSATTPAATSEANGSDDAQSTSLSKPSAPTKMATSKNSRGAIAA